MATAQKLLLQNIAEKQETGDLGSPVPFAADFDNVVDSRGNKGQYTLRQFFDNYVDFITSTDFIYYGVEQPSNSHIKIWVDTGHNNQE